MRWILDNVGLVIFFVIGFSIWRKAKKFMRQVTEEAERKGTTRPTGGYDPDESERVRKIQEEIRRKIAERRGGDRRGASPSPPMAEPPTVFRRDEIPPADPFAERRSPIPPPVLPYERGRFDTAQLERQEHLVEQTRMLEESRKLSSRRATQLAASLKTESESERGALTLSRKNLLLELRDPHSLRRAFVLREVLNAPVALR
ncbi:MAG: hypothetical protein ABIZ81_17975 [Opitutaceae bacterium]